MRVAAVLPDAAGHVQRPQAHAAALQRHHARRGDGRDARHAAEPLEQRVDGTQPLGVGAVAAEVRVDLQRIDVADVEAGIDRRRLCSERMKRPAETSSSSAIATCAATSPWRSQLRLRSAVACVPCSAGASGTREARSAGRSAKRIGAERREQHGEGDHARVELEIERDRHGQARLERREQTDERPPERQAGEAGGEREDQPFDEQLLQDPPARRAEREARRDLAPPFDRTREQDAGDVAARDQEHEAGQDLRASR